MFGIRIALPLFLFFFSVNNKLKAQMDSNDFSTNDSIVVIIAKVEVYPEKVELVLKHFPKLISVTRLEEGCIKYDLHRDLENDKVFWFYEHWKDSETHSKHMNSSHLKEYMELTEGAVEKLTLNKMKIQDI